MSYFRPYRYVKDESNDPLYSVVSKKFVFNMAAYPTIFMILGVFFMVTQVIVPIIAFSANPTITKPVENSVLGMASGFRDFEFSELGSQESFTSLRNIPDFYYISIPKLGIDRAKIETAPEDLDPTSALGHYIGSSYPGFSGNTFIYGHSVLPAFYQPDNYKTIFSTLYTLEVGDRFTIEFNNKKYVYEIESFKDLKPEDVNPLKGFKPGYLEESTVTLMTCSPPGTKLRRLLVNAVLVN